MPPEKPKITDIASPGRTTPPATSRPIIVTNHSILQKDPMIAEGARPDDGVNAQPATAPVIKRTAKTIAPVSADMQALSQENSAQSTAAAEVSSEQPQQPPTADVAAAPVQPTPAEKPEPSAPEPPAEPAAEATQQSPTEEAVPETERDVEAENSLEEAKALEAQSARDQQLEQLIESGEYFVPINAVRLKRSRIFVAAMCVLAVLLALVLVDALLDANIISIPFSIPHTHFFSHV